MDTPWLRGTLSLMPASVTDWSLLLLAGPGLLVTMELLKWVDRRRRAVGGP